jgi:Rrf2 family nitric oxide-sensitive transcriptional repressor
LQHFPVIRNEYNIAMQQGRIRMLAGELPRQIELAIATLVVLAEAGVGARLRTESIAKAIGTTSIHAARTVHLLGRAGFVNSKGGPSGAYGLARSPARISLAETITALGPARLKTKRLSGRTPIAATLDGIAAQAARTVETLYASYTIWDLVEQRKDVKFEADFLLEFVCVNGPRRKSRASVSD